MISDQRMMSAAEELFQAMLDSLPDENQCSATFTPQFQCKMKRLIRRVDHPVRHRVLRKVASIALVIFIGFMTILAVSPAARAAFFGWVKEQYESFTKYYYEGTVPEEPAACKYELSELPDGFEEISRSENSGDTIIYYANYKVNQLMYFAYSQQSDQVDYLVKSEAFTSSTVRVNNHSAHFYNSNDPTQANALVWEDSDTNTLFCISAFLDSASIVQIAEKVLRIQ